MEEEEDDEDSLFCLSIYRPARSCPLHQQTLPWTYQKNLWANLTHIAPEAGRYQNSISLKRQDPPDTSWSVLLAPRSLPTPATASDLRVVVLVY